METLQFIWRTFMGKPEPLIETAKSQVEKDALALRRLGKGG